MAQNEGLDVRKGMDANQFKQRTMAFGLRIIRLVTSLPNSAVNQVVGRQLLKAGTSIGANYRAACRARSRADFVGKMKISEEECDESLYWLEILVKAGALEVGSAAALMKEGNEILSLLVSSIKTARSKC